MFTTAFKRLTTLALAGLALHAHAAIADLNSQAIDSHGYDWTFSTGSGLISGGVLNLDNFHITSVSINGNASVWTNWLNADPVESWSLAPTLITAGMQHVAITGTGTGVISGHLDFTPAAAPLPSAPVPEPETYTMLLAGLGALGFIARRRRGSNSIGMH